MSEQSQAPAAEQAQEATQQPVSDAQEPATSHDPDHTDEAVTEPESDDIEWFREELARVRKEAASKRIGLNEERARAEQLEAKLKEAKTPEQVAEITNQLATENRNLRVEIALAKAEIDPKAAQYVKGNTAEEIAESIKGLKELLGSTTTKDADSVPEAPARPRELSGGLTPGAGKSINLDPRSLAANYKRR